VVLGGPIIAAQLAQVSMGCVDTVMAGRLSAADLAAVAVGASLWMPICVLGIGIMVSVSPTVAQSYGAGNIDAIGGHVRQGLWLSQLVGIVAFFAVRACIPILSWLEIDPAIVPTASRFLDAISWGVPAIGAFTALRGFSEAVSRPRPVMAISLLGLAANIAGNFIFMYGLLGMPRLGAVGCGVASAIVMWLMPASLALWIVCDPYYRRFAPLSRWEWPDWGQIVDLFKLGSPIGICLFMEGSMFSTVSLLMGRLGAEIVAGHQIALNVASVTFMVPLGIANAITVRVGQAIGAGSIPDARRSGFVGAGLALAFMTVTAATIMTFPHGIATLYTQDTRVHAVAVQLLAMAALFQVFDGLQVAGAGALRGAKDTAIPMGITILAYWGLGLPLGYWLGIEQNRGPQALWIGLTAGLVAAALMLNGRFWLLTRRLQRMPKASLPETAEKIPVTSL
jgi:MATE family multidrug resistance protein